MKRACLLAVFLAGCGQVATPTAPAVRQVVITRGADLDNTPDYQVYRNNQLIGVMPQQFDTFTDSGAQPNALNCYDIIGIDGSIQGAPSNTACVTPQAALLEEIREAVK